ncbi:hypothetical protein ACFVHQ_08390 [Actinomycetes bacterium NPDC127524]
MLVFFIFLLFLMNIVTIFAVIILFLRQNRLMHAEKVHANTMEEMENLLSSYLMEVKEENEAFLHSFNKKSQSGGISAPSAEDKKAKVDIKEKTAPGESPLLEPDMPSALKIKGGNVHKKKALRAYKNNPQKGMMEDQDDAIPQASPEDILEIEGIETPAVSMEQENSLDSTPPAVSSGTASFKDELLSKLAGKNEVQPSLSDEVFALYTSGMGTDDIAQKLKKGKTEIELLLKFRT